MDVAKRLCLSGLLPYLTEKQLLSNKNDLSGCHSWMVSKLITASYDGH